MTFDDSSHQWAIGKMGQWFLKPLWIMKKYLSLRSQLDFFPSFSCIYMVFWQCNISSFCSLHYYFPSLCLTKITLKATRFTSPDADCTPKCIARQRTKVIYSKELSENKIVLLKNWSLFTSIGNKDDLKLEEKNNRTSGCRNRKETKIQKQKNLATLKSWYMQALKYHVKLILIGN